MEDKKLPIWLAGVLASAGFLLVLAYLYLRYPGAIPLPTPQPSASPGAFENLTPFPLKGPAGFKISVFAKGLGPARMMVFDEPSGALFVSITREGKVLGLRDTNGDGAADERWVVFDGLRNPHGLAIRDGWLYIAEEHRVGRVKLFSERDTYQKLISGLPSGDGHFTRTIGFGPDGKLYVSVGSSCNVCFENNEKRATILQFNPDGSDMKVYATGLRNSVGFTWDSKGSMWATDNGRDLLGDNLPPEEINRIQEDRNYGWPVCYGNKIHDASFDKRVFVRDPCEDTETPVVELPAHSAPLGLRFDPSTLQQVQGRPEGLERATSAGQALYVALHGSWNRTQPAGYKVIKVNVETKKVEDFITGFFPEERIGQNLGASASQFAYGRPVDILFDDGGVMYISDDKAGMIYRVSKR